MNKGNSLEISIGHSWLWMEKGVCTDRSIKNITNHMLERLCVCKVLRISFFSGYLRYSIWNVDLENKKIGSCLCHQLNDSEHLLPICLHFCLLHGLMLATYSPQDSWKYYWINAYESYKLTGTSLVAQWLRFCNSTAGGVRLIPGPGTKIPHAMWCGQKVKIKKKLTKGQNHEWILCVNNPYDLDIVPSAGWGPKERKFPVEKVLYNSVQRDWKMHADFSTLGWSSSPFL